MVFCVLCDFMAHFLLAQWKDGAVSKIIIGISSNLRLEVQVYTFCL